MTGILKKIAGIVFVGVVTLYASGCCSYMVYENSKGKVATRKALLSGDQRAIKAVALGNGGVGIGIDVSNWEALSEQPLLQFGAAAADAALLWGGYEGVKSLSDNSSHSTTTGRDNVSINGDGNKVYVGNSDSHNSP